MNDTAAATELERKRRPLRWRRYVVRTAIVTALYFAMLVYPVVRLIGLVAPETELGTLPLLAIIVLPIVLRMLYERRPNAFTRACAAVALTWLGVCFQLFPLMIVFELANVVFDIPGSVAGWTLIGLIGGIGCIGFLNAQLLHVRSVSIAADEGVRGKTLVQVSDVHIGSRSPGLLRRIVAKVNAIDADYVLITGDLIDFAGISRDQLRELGRLTRPAYFVIGNHERYVDLNAICERLRALGIRVLRDEYAIAGPFQFIGVDDADSPDGVAQAIAKIGVSRDHYPVLLYHRPDGFDAAVSHHIPLTLTGHTHAGQIIPFNFIVKRVYPRFRGLHRLGDSLLYVSPGTGTWGPVLRFGSRSEITRIVFGNHNPETDHGT